MNDPLTQVTCVENRAKADKFDGLGDLLHEPLVKRKRVGNGQTIIDKYRDNEVKRVGRCGRENGGMRRDCPTAHEDGMICFTSSVVFAGSVRSGLLTLRDLDRDLDRSTVTIKGKKTGLNRPRLQFSVHGPVLTSPGLNWFKTGLDQFFANY